MRIKQLELTGFKSFPQRTLLEFPAGVTGVVGPNGCGKSNIVDAIRWVLGEQSAKQLRGKAMEAVIFDGNDRAAPLGMAEVSLTFDNEGGAGTPAVTDPLVSTLPSQFRDLAEVCITRRYFRSGDSEYFINKTPCRLKDITELFLGTGVGARAYAIIEQARVGDFVKAKPEERRLLIEEAAGTTLYRSRKLSAERKMERTRENLARVNDVLREIDRQIAYLQRQARKAEEFQRLQAEVRSLELRLAGAQWRQLQARLSELDGEREALAGNEREARAGLAEAEAAGGRATEELSASEGRHMQVREALAVLDTERDSLRERLAMLEREREERGRRQVRIEAELEGIATAGEQVRGELERVAAERDRETDRLDRDRACLRELEEEARGDRERLAEAQAELEAARGALMNHLSQQVEVRNGLAALDRRREDGARQFARLRAEREELEKRLREIDRQGTARRADVEGLRERLAAASGERESLTERLRGLEESRRRCEREAAALQAEFMQARSRLDSLEEIQSNYEGFQRGVRAIMREEQHPDGVLGVVAEVVDIPREYERAAAAVLGERLQYVIVEGEEAGVSAVDSLRAAAGGRSSFIPLRPRVDEARLRDAASLNGSSRRMLDLVSFEDRYRDVAESLLGEVVLVPDLQTALSVWKRNGIRVTLVTPEGDVMAPSGVVTGGSDRPLEEEILGRRREIEELRQVLSVLDGRVKDGRAVLDRVRASIAETDAALRQLGEGAHELTVQIVAAEKDIERLEFDRPQCVSRRDVVRYELDALQEEDVDLVRQSSELRSRSEQLAVAHAEREGRVTSCAAALRQASENTQRRGDELTAAKVAFAEARERQQAALAQAENLRQRCEDLLRREKILRGELEAARREGDERLTEMAAARQHYEDGEARRAGLTEQVQKVRVEVEQAAARRQESERHARETRQALEELREQAGRVEVARSEVRLRVEHLEESIRERHDESLGECAAEMEQAEIDEAENQRLQVLRRRLERIGQVNLGALDELHELEERATFLRTQRDDLQSSLADLERTIQKLNRISRSRFAETFARANETFQKVYPRLVQGGEARLVLTDEKNLLESGVEIIARPPGKRLGSTDPLSGGEKALVAVSLIFSLFLINPTPFCVLDEVDAPLDDANIGRFVELVRELSEKLQFVLITHNKRSMEAADRLYGITMQEPGISNVISVSMN